MVQNDIRFVFTAPLTPDGEIAEHVRAHGDGVHDIAFAVDDVESAWRETTTRGAVSALEPTELDGGEDGVLRRSSIHTYGEVLHSFVDRSRLRRRLRPGLSKGQVARRGRRAGCRLLEVDHCVGNVGLGQMDQFVDFYRDVLGFAQLIHYDDKVIHTEYSALMSKVMTNGNGRIKFPINEPATGKKKSQIQEYLDWYRSPGCQHIAMRTEDIVGTVRRLRDNGIEFLGLPHEYYATLADRVGDVGVPIDTLEELGIEADRDEEGYLLQIFTRPVQDRPTFFFEIIERHGSRGFGVGNFKALVRGHRTRTGEAREPLAVASVADLVEPDVLRERAGEYLHRAGEVLRAAGAVQLMDVEPMRVTAAVQDGGERHTAELAATPEGLQLLRLPGRWRPRVLSAHGRDRDRDVAQRHERTSMTVDANRIDLVCSGFREVPPPA